MDAHRQLRYVNITDQNVDFYQMQLYGPKHYSRYNMFNHHFFDGEKSVDSLTSFLNSCSCDQVAMVFDPPFGGMVEALTVSIRKLSDLWKEASQGIQIFIFKTFLNINKLQGITYLYSFGWNMLKIYAYVYMYRQKYN